MLTADEFSLLYSVFEGDVANPELWMAVFADGDGKSLLLNILTSLMNQHGKVEKSITMFENSKY